MSRFTTTIPPDYFDGMYAATPDPWQFADSPYERAKYAATMAALPRARYANALEVGCSIGVLTREIATRCDALLSLDVADRALAQATARNADRPQVRFANMRVPAEWPLGSFDLVVLSEVVYYLDANDILALSGRLRAGSAPGADLVLVHWLGETHYPMSGDEAADLLISSSAGFTTLQHQARTADYRLDLLRATATPG